MRYILLLILVIPILPAISRSQDQLPLIPYPVSVKQHPGKLSIVRKVTVSIRMAERKELFNYLRAELKSLYGIEATEVEKESEATIRLSPARMPSSGKPAYRLTSNASGVAIQANFSVSAFHGIQTLLQLISPMGGKDLPYVEIFDYPRFEYRGMHLDVSRHFFPVSFIRQYIDYLARHKFNRFHWHLTDDQGWRIQINRYPALTEVGGWRNGTIIGRYPGKGNDNLRYGGYYTREEIREVVSYARERHIEVIPEIEMPGHGSAAIAAYPWLSCFPAKPTAIPAGMISAASRQQQADGRIKLVQETWGVFEDVFCAGNDSTFLFLENVIDEVADLFPSKFFHIGGDECPKKHWQQCPKCQARMRELKLKDEHELQSYFVQRIEKYLNSKGKILIGWDEILEGGLAPRSVVMSWRGEHGGIAAARQSHEVIMTPGNPVYFDHTQTRKEDSVTIGGYNPLDSVYLYEPIPAELDSLQHKYVIGAQANLWTEYITNQRKVEYMIFPRMSALSEVLWSPAKQRNRDQFLHRLKVHEKRYKLWGANYFPGLTER